MDVRVMHEILSPGVNDGGKADFGAEMFGVGGKSEKGLGCSLEEDVVNHLLILQSDGCQGIRYGEDDMVIFDWQDFSTPGIQPFSFFQSLTLWAVSVSAGVVLRTENFPLLEARIVPTTSKLVDGIVVPMPTLPFS